MYSCRQAKIEMQDQVAAGLFAECTYRTFDLIRCTATPVRFTEVKFAQDQAGNAV